MKAVSSTAPLHEAASEHVLTLLRLELFLSAFRLGHFIIATNLGGVQNFFFLFRNSLSETFGVDFFFFFFGGGAV